MIEKIEDNLQLELEPSLVSHTEEEVGNESISRICLKAM